MDVTFPARASEVSCAQVGVDAEKKTERTLASNRSGKVRVAILDRIGDIVTPRRAA
jgi:hypothetical protein